ncbi:MAG: glycoside hydrolase domain-containing protein [Actinomycetota bacterium]
MHPSRSSSRTAVLLAAVASLVGVLIPPGSAAASARKTISYRGVSVSLPAAWPVVDLAEDPSRCARFDVSVVYLGHQGDDAVCPTILVGAAEAVHLEPWDARTDAVVGGMPQGKHNGEPARVEQGTSASGRTVIAFERPRTIVRVTFGDDEALADEIAASARASGAVSSGSPSASGGGPAPSSSEVPSPSAPAAPTFTAAANAAPLQPGIFAGDGFDTCENPALEKMQAWLVSPYRAIGIYVGGVNHGCKAQTLSADWVADTARMGWSFWPLYVGRQAPCYSGSNTALIDPASASAQGTAAANDAIAQADKFGLPTGSPLYFDMEAYSGTATCVTAVKTFLNAWTQRLHVRGYLSGVYSSEASGVAKLSAQYDDPGFVPPDVIWTAHWDEPKRIFGHNQTWLPDSLWTNHQRIHQHEGGHIETWGSQSINIDNDFADAPAVRFAAVPRWLSGQFDGTGGSDLVHLCCSDYANTWMTQGDGTFTVTSFRPWAHYGLQAGRYFTLDLSGDGKDDLLHFRYFDSTYGWISDGDGTYTMTSFRPWPGYNLSLGTWHTGDFNGDGRDDLLHLCCADYAHLWLSDGDGTFTVVVWRPWSGYKVQLGGWTTSDVNGDARTDLVHFCCADYVHVWLSDGDGTFTTKVYRPWPGYGIHLGRWLTADANGDGKGDLIHLCCADYAYTWLSNGVGGYSVKFFRPWPGYSLQKGRWLVTDAGGDDKDDLVHLCCADKGYRWNSNGDGTYAMTSHQPWPGYNIQAGTWFAGDADADGDGDLYHLCCATIVYTWFSQANQTYDLIVSPI